MKVEIKNLIKNYHDKPILNVNQLVIDKNRTICIRGRNGTGKTTFMKIVANLLGYNQGEILYDGESINPEIMKRMTYVPQNPYIYNTSVYQNIIYPLKLRDMDVKDIENRIDEYLTYFELDQIKDQNAKKCSSGQKMKIGLIRGMIFKPELLLLDEPTTNLDVESIEKLKKQILSIKKETTIIFISHDIDFIKSIRDVEFLLKDTKLELGD